MPLPQPGSPPGGAGGSNKYPQWGVKLDQAKKSGKIIEAHNEHQKLADMNAGYLQWFQSRKAAQNWIPSQFTFALPNPLSGLNAVGDFFYRLTEAQTWVRVAEVGAGVLLLYMGLKAVVTPGGQHVARRTVRDTAHSVGSGVK